MYSASTGGCIWSKERWRPKRRSRVDLPLADQEPQLIKASIVAIHGLNPLNDKDHALNTWRKPKTAEGMLWLRDCLPQTTPKARILIYEYNSNPVFATSKERFVHQANDLLERLHIARDMVSLNCFRVVRRC